LTAAAVKHVGLQHSEQASYLGSQHDATRSRSSGAGSSYRSTAGTRRRQLSVDICGLRLGCNGTDRPMDKRTDRRTADRYAHCAPHTGSVNKKLTQNKKGKGRPCSITERRVPELIPVLGSQPAGDVCHKSDGMLPLLSDRPAVTPAILKKAATNFAAW